MSDVEGSDGNIEDVAAELSSKNWETRLEIAREQRAAALAEAQKSREPKTPSGNCHETPQSEALAEPGESKFEQVVFKSTQSKHPTTHPRRRHLNRMYPVIAGAMLCGAFLHWATTSVLAGWRNPDAVIQASLPIETKPEISARIEPREDYVPLPNLEPDTAEPITHIGKLKLKDAAAQPKLGLAERDPIKPLGYTPPQVIAITDALSPPVLQNSDQAKTPLKSMPDVVYAFAITHGSAPTPPELTDNWPVQDRTKETEVSLFVPVGVSNETSINVLEVLTSDQTDVVATARVNFSIKATQVRYYHAKDAEIADLTAKALGGISRDFTKAGSKTRPGHIEVYLAGKGGGKKSRPDPVERFVARIIEEFQ